MSGASAAEAALWEVMARQELYRIDRRDSAAVSRFLINLTLRGASSLPPEGDPARLLVVPLGGGRRKTWAHLDSDDMFVLDCMRYRNARAAANAYDAFRRRVTEPWRPVLRRHATIGDALKAGDLPTVEDLT